MLKKILCSVSLVFLALVSAKAQEVPKAEVFGGYSWSGGNFHAPVKSFRPAKNGNV